MKTKDNLCLDVRLMLPLPEAIDQWLAARDAYKMERSGENEDEYNATYFDLGAAFCERYPEATNTPGAFEWYRRGLIAPGGDE